jgi:hypothetical protein
VGGFFVIFVGEGLLIRDALYILGMTSAGAGNIFRVSLK